MVVPHSFLTGPLHRGAGVVFLERTPEVTVVSNRDPASAALPVDPALILPAQNRCEHRFCAA